MEPNPYESPKTDQPLQRQQVAKREQVAKRAVAYAAILLLTPPAMVVAVWTCCSVGPIDDEQGLVVLWIPFGLLIALMIAAAVVYRPNHPTSKSDGPRVIALLTTPICVGLAAGVGFWWAALNYGNQLAMGVAFFFPPAITLLAMLFLAWRWR